MMASHFAPKCRSLTAHETSASFEVWKDNIIFNLTIDGSFEDFLEPGVRWGKTSVPSRGLKPDPAGDNRRTAKEKAALLQLMLGSIASYAPVISRQYIVSDALMLCV